MARTQGRVKSFNGAKGFGFIAACLNLQSGIDATQAFQNDVLATRAQYSIPAVALAQDIGTGTDVFIHIKD